MIYKEQSRHTVTKPIEYLIDESTDCWNCVSHSLSTGGYPQISRGGKRWIMSRYIYTIQYGPISNGLVVRHTCDNPCCINPMHLEIGTQLENISDATSRGRINRGSSVPTAKLTEEIAKSIREEYKYRNVTQEQLADKYKISRSMISFIVNGVCWRHV